MVITYNEDMESKSDRSNCEDMPPLEDYTDKKVAQPAGGEPWL